MKVMDNPTIEETGGTAHWFIANDGARLRYAEFPASAQHVGSVLFLTGYTEFIEKHLESIEQLKSRGYSVLIMDWRGLGLSHRELPESAKGHISSFDLYISDLMEILAETDFANRPGRRILLAHSMGGHLAMRLLHDRPGLCHLAVLCAPMADIRTGRIPRLVAPIVGALIEALGLGNAFVIGGNRDLDTIRRFEGNPLTSDQPRFDRTHRFIDREPGLMIGGPTFHWVVEALKSIEMVNQDRYLAEISNPVLIIGAGNELIVDNEAQQNWADKIQDGARIEISEGYHELMNETDDIYRQFWEAFDHFVGERLE